MTQETFTIKKAYALSAIDKAGNRVYYDTDSHSGGYPYWSLFFNQFKTWESLDKVPVQGGESYMRNEVTSIQVIEVEVNAKVVSTTQLVSEARAKAEAEIAKIQKELAQKIAMLEGVE